MENFCIYFSPNTNLDVQDEVSECLRMESTEDFGKYLGVPTINGRSSKRYYQYLVDRIDVSLQGGRQKL